MIHFKENKNKSALSTRWAQMSKQEQIIEKKKMEIQAKLEAQKNAAALAAQAKLANPAPSEEAGSQNIFSNDGSFMSQYKALLERQNKEKQEKEEKEKQEKQEKNEELQRKKIETKQKDQIKEEDYEVVLSFSNDRRQERQDGRHREKHRRWSDRNRNRTHSPFNCMVDDRKNIHDTNHIPSLMQLSVMPPGDQSPSNSQCKWNPHADSDSNDEYDQNSNQDFDNFGPDSESTAPPGSETMNSLPMGPGLGPGMGPGFLGAGPMGPGNMSFGPMGHGPMGHGPMGSSPMGHVPMGSSPMGHVPMGPGPMGPGPMGLGPMGPGHMGPGSMGPGPMGPGPMGPGPMGPGPMGPGPMRPGPMGSGPMGPGRMGPGPMRPGPMGSGHVGPGSMGPGPLGPGPMPPGTMGPVNNTHAGQNIRPGNANMQQNLGPGNSNMNQNMGSGNPNMSPNMGSRNSNKPPSVGSPANSNMPPPPMPFMNGPPNFPMPPNFMGPNAPSGPRGPGVMPPNMPPNLRGPRPNGPMPPFFPPNGPPNSMMPQNTMNNDSRFMGPRPPFGPNGPNFGPNNMGGSNMAFMSPNLLPPNVNEPKPLDAMPPALKHPPLPPMLTQENENTNIPLPNKKVLSADMFQSSVHRAAAEVASNGDHWESVLKAMNSQDQSMWFLHNTNSNEYKMYRDLVNKMRNTRRDEIKPEDKYEPEFSLEDDDSNDNIKPNKDNLDSNFYSNYPPYQYNNTGVKREASSQSDEECENKRERRKKRKSRWGDDPPVDIKPPGMAPLPPPPLPGAQLSKIDGDGLKLSTLNRHNQALMQYAMTNYGTVNLSPEDWKKCEDNFKLNLLFQDMLKKRQEVERLAAAGKHKYEYDSDEDTAEGTWEHKLRAKEMNATEKWADELTKQAAGKHHIGDFLPPEELKKFMEKYTAVKGGKEPDLSDYKEYKLKEDNVGFKMLQKLGWNEGQGLGAEGTGIVEPINKANQPVANMGLGAKNADVVSSEDDEFDAYRKRMMLAYRFRPNPLNNPRRPYY